MNCEPIKWVRSWTLALKARRQRNANTNLLFSLQFLHVELLQGILLVHEDRLEASRCH